MSANAVAWVILSQFAYADVPDQGPVPSCAKLLRELVSPLLMVRVACVLRRGDHVPFDAFIPPIRLVAPCRAIPLPAWFVSGFGERASVPRLGFGLGRIWVLRVFLPLSIYHICV